MDLDHRFRPNSGLGNRIILLGDGTEISTEAPDSDMFDHDDEDKDLDSQVDKFQSETSNGGTRNAREATPGPNQAQETTESPSSVKTDRSDKSESAEPPPAENKDSRQPDKKAGASEK